MTMKDKIEKLVLGLTALASLGVALLDLFGALDNVSWLSERIPTISLLVISTITIYMILEREEEKQDLKNIEQKINDNADKLLKALSGVDVTVMKTTEEGFNYLAKRYSDPQTTHIHQAATAPSTNLRNSADKRYRQAITRMLKHGKVRYTYVAVFDESRWSRTKEILMGGDSHNFYVNYYSLDYNSTVPPLSFVIIDSDEVIVRYPYAPGETEMFVSIKHADAVGLFYRYFTVLLNGSTTLDKTQIEKEIEKIEKKLNFHVTKQ